MARTGVLIGYKAGNPEVICLPDVSLVDQLRKVKDLIAAGADSGFEALEHYNSAQGSRKVTIIKQERPAPSLAQDRARKGSKTKPTVPSA